MSVCCGSRWKGEAERWKNDTVKDSSRHSVVCGGREEALKAIILHSSMQLVSLSLLHLTPLSPPPSDI